MADLSDLVKTVFHFGSTTVQILQCDILAPGVDEDALVSSDDNYLTMGSGVSRLLADQGGRHYVHAAQAQSPVKVGTVVVTGAHQLAARMPSLKYVLHGAVIDYDTYDLPLEQSVYQTTMNCLEKAEELGVRGILFPALGSGAGGLTMEACARQMCGAIKSYLAHERPIKTILLMLFLPQAADGAPAPADTAQFAERNRGFIREANLVLGVPYNPASNILQTRDFYGRDTALQQIQAVLAGEKPGKRHALILGGPAIGKSALLDRLAYLAQQPANGQGRSVARVVFGRVHEGTPASFVYRKLLLCLRQGEEDAHVIREIKRLYAQSRLTCRQFLKFLQEHADHYPDVLFLIDNLPQLLLMGCDDLWRDLNELEARIRFAFTATADDQYQKLRDRLSDSFKAGLEEIPLRCVSEDERETWVNQLYQQYLDRDATGHEHDFIEEEAGLHPYLISLASYTLIEAIKRDALVYPTRHPGEYTMRTLTPFFQAARKGLEVPRRAFFDMLMGPPCIGAAERADLENLAKAADIEERKVRLARAVGEGDQEAAQALHALTTAVDPRLLLHDDRLRALESRGYLLGCEPNTAQFMAKSFATWVKDYYGVGNGGMPDDRPRDVRITLLRPEPEVIRTLFRGNGPRSVLTLKRLVPNIRANGMKYFGQLLSHLLHPTKFEHPGELEGVGVLKDLEDVGTFILTGFTTGEIKRYLQNPPQGSTILLEIDDALKDIPWELMLETGYGDEIPFGVGRTIAFQEGADRIKPVVRGNGKIKALLIGDPTDDLVEARNEVETLNDWLRRDERFATPDVLIGSEQCQQLQIYNALSNGTYGLIHYSGHTHFAGDRSAWQLKDGNVTTDLLTETLQMGPPALVFSSSCQSAVGGEPQPIQYENQTFDLPSAFLQAGVEAYIGTLWEVDSLFARRFVEEFYIKFLSGEHNLGACLRSAKTVSKQRGDRINWPAFILYGDPHVEPGDLFPAMRKRAE